MKRSLATSLLSLCLISGISHALESPRADEKVLTQEANAALAKKDYATAFSKYSVLAERGAPLAQFNLGAFYLNGQGVRKNEQLAFEWFGKSAAQGNANALQVIEKSAAKGNIHAKNELNKLLGQPVEAQAQPQQAQPQKPQPVQRKDKPAPTRNRAATTEPGMHLLLNLGITFGGDTIFSASTTTGEEKEVKGGELVQLGIGGLYQFEDAPVALAFSINKHMDTVTASNGEIKFTRNPYEALVYYTGAENFRFGGGIRIVTSPESSITINGATEKIVFDNARGYVAELGYKAAKNLWINVRYVSEKYQGRTYTFTNGSTASIAGSTPFDGSHFGIFTVFEF